MLKKVGIVVVGAVAGLMMVGGPASAAVTQGAPDPTFGDAYATFNQGGGEVGHGAASMVSGAYTGIALTPALVAHSVPNHG